MKRWSQHALGFAIIFVGPDPVADRVVGTGDVLDSSGLTNVSSCDEALNASGQVVFQAQLEDGRTGIFVASPDA